MQGDPKTIELLNELLAEELSAADQYFIHAEMYKDFGLHKLFERIDHEREDELSHARVLIARTLFLQGKPNVAARAHRGGRERASDAGQRSGSGIPRRQSAEKVVAHCESVQDYVTRQELMVLLEETENDHAHWLEQQLRLIDMVGEQNYIQSQM